MELERIKQLAGDVATSLGFEIIDLQFFPGKPGRKNRRARLALFIDRPEGKSSENLVRPKSDSEKLADSHVTIDDCYRFSKQLEHELEILEKESGTEFEPYLLEVSSPGAHRPLLTDAHFLRFLGREAEFQLFDLLEIGRSPRRHFSAILKARDARTTEVEFTDNGVSQRVLLQNTQIKKATLVPRLPW